MTRTSTRLLAGSGIAALAVALTGGAASAAPAAGASTTATPAAGCPAGPVATAVAGNPKLKAHQAEGVYVFHDSKGYEVEVTHPGKAKVVYSGTLTASKGFAKLDRVKLEGSDYVTETADHKQIDFRLTNVGGIDGFHAYGDCSAAVKVSLRINGKTAPTGNVFLGKDREHPTSVPFTIDRSKSIQGTPTTSAATSA